MAYRNKINYYYYQANNYVTDIKEFKLNESKYTKVDAKESIYHNYNYNEGNFNILESNSNLKYTSYEDGKEVILSPDRKRIIKDPVVTGTFNYFTYKGSDVLGKAQHVRDIQTWIDWGSGINDSTTKEERFKVFMMGTFISMNYVKIQNWAKDNKLTKIGEKELKKFSEFDSFSKAIKSVNDVLKYQRNR